MYEFSLWGWGGGVTIHPVRGRHSVLQCSHRKIKKPVGNLHNASGRQRHSYLLHKLHTSIICVLSTLGAVCGPCKDTNGTMQQPHGMGRGRGGGACQGQLCWRLNSSYRSSRKEWGKVRGEPCSFAKNHVGSLSPDNFIFLKEFPLAVRKPGSRS